MDVVELNLSYDDLLKEMFELKKIVENPDVTIDQIEKGKFGLSYSFLHTNFEKGYEHCKDMPSFETYVTAKGNEAFMRLTFVMEHANNKLFELEYKNRNERI